MQKYLQGTILRSLFQLSHLQTVLFSCWTGGGPKWVSIYPVTNTTQSAVICTTFFNNKAQPYTEISKANYRFSLCVHVDKLPFINMQLTPPCNVSTYAYTLPPKHGSPDRGALAGVSYASQCQNTQQQDKQQAGEDENMHVKATPYFLL